MKIARCFFEVNHQQYGEEVRRKSAWKGCFYIEQSLERNNTDTSVVHFERRSTPRMAWSEHDSTHCLFVERGKSRHETTFVAFSVLRLFAESFAEESGVERGEHAPGYFLFLTLGVSMIERLICFGKWYLWV